jgi:hypothetical protein
MRNRRLWTVSLAAILATVLVACAGVPRDRDESSPLEHYVAHAGDPVDRVYTARRLRSWHPIDREHLTVRIGPDSYYLLTVAPGCVGLRHTHAIGLTAHGGRNTLLSGRDEVILANDRCRIMAIRPLDYAALQESLKLAGH